MNPGLNKVLITGGTGFVGKSLCKKLTQLGFDVYVLTRQPKVNKHLANTQVKYINNLDEINGIGINTVINLAGSSIAQRWSARAKQEIYNSRITTTRNLVEYLSKQNTKPQVLIGASAVGYYGTPAPFDQLGCLAKGAFDEESVIRNNPENFAQNICHRWEEEAVKAEEFGIRVVRLRIGPVLGKDGGMIAKLLPSFKLGLGGYMGGGNQWLSWIDIDDLVDLIIFLIFNNQIRGPVNATAPNPITNKEFSIALAKALSRPCFLKTPAFVLRAIFGEMAEEMIIQGQKVLPKKALSSGFVFSFPTVQQSLEKIFLEKNF